MAIFAWAPHKITLGKALVIGVAAAEVAGFMFAPKETLDVNRGVRDFGMDVGEVALDDGLERAVCGLGTVVTFGGIDYNGDCLKNLASSAWDNLSGADTEDEPDTTSPPSQSTVPAAPATPAPATAAPAPVVPVFENNLVDDMTGLGYSCANEIVLAAGDGEGAIDLMVRGGTSRETANAAYERGAFSGVDLFVGETALVGACG